MTRAAAAGGFTLIEVLAALVLLALAAGGVVETLASAQRARGLSVRRMQAAQLAAAGIEQLRAGQALEPLVVAGGFARAGSVTPWMGRDDLVQLEVSVSWNDTVPQRLRLATLVCRRAH